MVDEKMPFINLKLQQSIWSKLSQLKSSHRIANAYLFSGSRGSGKEAIALKFATYVNCTAVDGPCGECASCRRFRFLQHEHLKLIVPMPSEVKSSGNAVVAATAVASCDFTDSTWSSASFTAAFGAIYNDDQGDKLCVVLDFSGDKTATNGTFKVTFPRPATAADAIISMA